MTQLSTSSPASGIFRSDRLALIIILTVTVIRVALLPFSQMQLHGDEAQYWSWAQTLDWGYFSKPPLIAWIIAATTGLFGDAEWAARLGSPLIHAITAGLIYLIGKRLGSGPIGLWAVIIYLTLPAVFLSSGIISTDVPLLACYALALLALLRLRDGPHWGWAVILGIAIGLGLLAKYAMIYFILSAAIACVIDRPVRRALLSLQGGLIALLAALVFAPNIIWNAQNDFQTVGHTAANANVGGVPFHPLELLEFWASQSGIFGLVFVVIFVLAVLDALRKKTALSRLLLCFALLPLLVISVQALISRANANWAATSIIAACPLIALWGVETVRRFRWIKIGLFANIVLGLAAVSMALSPALADELGQANVFKRTRAWPQTVDAVLAEYQRGFDGHSFDGIVVDNRLVFYDFTYYGLTDSAPLYMWLKQPVPHNHAEATAPLPEGGGLYLMAAHYADHGTLFAQDFETLTPLGEVTIDLGGGKTRRLFLYAGQGYARTNVPRD